jgi:DNA-binding GntR family transcriptional regulator
LSYSIPYAGYTDCLAPGFLRRDVLRNRRSVQGFCRITGTPANLRAAFEEHLRILEALEAGRSEAARQVMVDHFTPRLQTLLGMLVLKENTSSTPAPLLSK